MLRSLIVVYLSLICAAAIIASGANAQTQSSAPGEQPSGSSSGPAIERQSVKSYSLPPEKYEKAVAYSRTQYRLHFVGVAYSLLLLLIILSLRIAPALRDWSERVSRRRFVQAIVFVPLLLLTFDALKFPLDIYQHHLAVHYDISVQGWGSWFWDWTKGELIQFVIASILAYILFGVIRRSRRRWWLYFGLASLPMLVFLLFISPVIIDPLFNKFEPLQAAHPALVAEIEKVVTHGGLDIPRERMFEMKASEKVNAIDAYVTGFGASKRVVVWDTTIAKMTSPQTMFVVGHEMGHYVLGHILKGIAFAGALTIVVLLLVHFAINRTLAHKQRRWALRGLDDWASLPALLLFIYLFFFLAEPAFNTFSRYQEHQADVYGLEVIHGIVPDSSATAAEAFQILGEVDLADPDPSTFIKVWLYSHPPLSERLTFAREYDPWAKGQPTMFVRLLPDTRSWERKASLPASFGQRLFSLSRETPRRLGWLRSQELFDFLEVGGDVERIGRNVDASIAALGDHSCRSLLRLALDPEDEAGQVARAKPSSGFDVPVAEDGSLLVDRARVAIDYRRGKHSSLDAGGRLRVTEVMVDRLNGAVPRIGRRGILSAGNNAWIARTGARFIQVSGGNLELDVSSPVEIEQKTLSEIGPPNERAILTFFSPLFPALLT